MTLLLLFLLYKAGSEGEEGIVCEDLCVGMEQEEQQGEEAIEWKGKAKRGRR